MDYSTLLETRLLAADSGRNYWNRLCGRLGLGNRDVVILLMESDKECAEIIMKYGEFLIKLDKYEKIYVLTDSEGIFNAAGNKGWIREKILCAHEDMEALIFYYQLYNFSRQVIFGSLKNTEDADGTRLCGVNNIGLEEIIATAVLDIPYDKCRLDQRGN